MLRAYFSSTPGFGPATYDSRARFGLSDANPCSFVDAHVTVTVKDGVVILEGLVFDAWDIVTATRIARKIPGVKRVFIELADSGD